MSDLEVRQLIEQWRNDFSGDRQNVEALVANFSDQVVNLWAMGGAMVGKEEAKNVARSAIGKLTEPFSEFDNLQAQIDGDIGVIWGHYRLRIEMPGVGPALMSGRVSGAARRSGDQWRWVLTHFESPLSANQDKSVG